MRERLGGVSGALARAARSARTLEERLDWPPGAGGGRFAGLYDDIMDEVVEDAGSRGVSLREVERAYRALAAGDRHLTSHEGLMDRTGMDYHTARQAAAVLSDAGDLHECYDEDWNLHWARCDGFIARKCEERRISLWRYFRMYDTLHEFQNEVVGWYVRRNRRQKQPFNLRDLKEQYVHELRREYFPDKPVGDEWSRHIAARYLRTAQDSIVRSFELTYGAAGPAALAAWALLEAIKYVPF
jgi:hypothetical protein